MKKGLYGMFTSFLFVIIALLFLFSLLFYQNILVKFQGEYHNSMSEFQVISDSKEKIFQCFGNPINLDLAITNELECDNILINKFEITRFDKGQCNYLFANKTIKNTQNTKMIQYYVPIRKDTTSSMVCLGTLKLFI